MENLPGDCMTALRKGFQFSYWKLLRSSIGSFNLKIADQLAVTTISTFPGCQSIMNDPFQPFEGMYHIDVIDLVADSSRYNSEGLFCWIPKLACFGAIDPEHGDVLTFPAVTWGDIVKSPKLYLDAQWGRSSVGVRVLPWVHFPFRIKESAIFLSPYPAHCDLHKCYVTEHDRQRHPMFDAYRDRDRDAWLNDSRSSFPWSGIPTDTMTLLSCKHCFDAETAWLQRIDDSILVLDARKNKGGFIQCPGCGIRFSPTDRFSFVNAMHSPCGQKINVVEHEAEP